MNLNKTATLVGILSVLLSIAVTFGMQMERLSTLQADMRELKATVQQVMLAIGTIEHREWKETR